MSAAALILAGIVVAVRSSHRPSAGRTPWRDLSAESPYRNVRPGVAYVGDAVCAQCHGEIASAFQSHPMGRSMVPVGGAAEGPPIDAPSGLPFEFKGVSYDIERRDGRTYHRAVRRDSGGQVLSRVEDEVRYALGSGTRGTSYLIERDGFLFQSPIAWFAQKKRWDISPGYGLINPRPNFERAIQRDCLFCHTNQIHAVSGTLNRYEPPIFEGHAIGCERCHGPGALHVVQGEGSSGPDMTIVNPAHLTPVLRESVCQQCHLQGWFRFPKAGRSSFDFRPGLPLRHFIAVFVREEDDPERVDLIGQVEQMESSRCFRASDGQLACISCHDPHRLPPPETKVAYYRERCLACHGRKGCSLPLAERQGPGKADDCVACHMPRPAITNLPHTVTTDHRIPRNPDTTRPKPARSWTGSGLPPDFTPRDYFQHQMTRDEKLEAGRDMGVALELAAQELLASPPLARRAAARAVPLLETAVRAHPDDLRARESLGYALGMLDRLSEARQVYEETLRIEPGRELALPYLARTYSGLNQPDLAAATMREVIAVNPWRSDYRLALARYCEQARDWPGVVSACLEAIRLNPELVEARSLLVQGYLGTGDRTTADARFQEFLAFHPADHEAWRRWYEERKQSGPRASGHASNRRP